MANPLRIDPTRTTMLRRAFMAEMKRRFGRISSAILKLVVEDDVFGLAPEKPITFNYEKQAWRFRTDAEKIAAYRFWLQQQIDEHVLSVKGGIASKPWTAMYVESAFKKGMLRSYLDVRKEDLSKKPEFFKGSQAEFLRSAFSQPETVSKVELLATRAFTDLKGVTDTMSALMSRTLANGIAQGKGPMEIARELKDSVDSLTRTRAVTIARTEIIAAHAEGQLDSFEALGVEEVGVMAEWSTAGDDHVCEECEPLQGVIMTVEEARGLLPRHPNCRCSWVPALKDRKETGQVRGKGEVKQAVIDSIKAERPGADTNKEATAQSAWAGKELLN